LNKRTTLLQSLIVLLISVGLVALFGIIPLPTYDTEINQSLQGSIFFSVGIESRNIIPPAPDIVDECILKIDISIAPIKEEKVICKSDLYQYSYDFYLTDPEIDEDGNIILRYWDNLTNSEMALIIDIKNSGVKETDTKNISSNRNMYEINVLGEKLLTPWEMRETSARTASIFYQKNSEIIEVFTTQAPTNYYFESLRWSPDGKNIVALDTENNILFFSKTKKYDPIKLLTDNIYLPSFDGDERVIYQIIGWRS